MIFSINGFSIILILITSIKVHTANMAQTTEIEYNGNHGEECHSVQWQISPHKNALIASELVCIKNTPKVLALIVLIHRFGLMFSWRKKLKSDMLVNTANGALQSTIHL